MHSKKIRSSTRFMISERIIRRLRLLTILCFITFGTLTVDICRGNIGILLALLGLGIGLTIGVVVCRMFATRWDEQNQKVVARIDWIGAIILISYILFRLGRDQFLAHWVFGEEIAALAISISTGTMMGRLLGTVHATRITLHAFQPLGKGTSDETPQ